MRNVLTVFFNELNKGMLLMWRARLNNLLELFSLGFIFVGILVFMGSGQIDQQRLAPALIGYIVWFFAINIISNMSSSLSEEAQAGTLEQLFMGSADPLIVVSGRVMTALLWTLLQSVLLIGGLLLLLNISIPLRWQGGAIFLLTLLGLIGFGFIMGGITLIFKNIAPFAYLVQNLLLFANGTLVAIDRFPPWLADISRYVPTTQGIIVLRNVLLNAQPIHVAWQDGSLVFLTVHSIVLLIGGVLVFRQCERMARRRGSLGQY